MADFLELDFWDVESDKSGDALSVRYTIAGTSYIHVIDAGFQATGPSIVDNIRKYYDDPVLIDHVVATHADGDHAGGLRSILTEFRVGRLWMIRPWIYAEQLLRYFPTYTSADRLRSRLKAVYPNLVELESLAETLKIPISAPFQGEKIGIFEVSSPTVEHMINCVQLSEKTPESEADRRDQQNENFLSNLMRGFAKLVQGAWGAENFSTEPTSAENEMSVVQYAEFNGKKILLTADAGREALEITIDHLLSRNVELPGIHYFQVPHHGSRRNVSSDILDRLLGPKVPSQLTGATRKFDALISSAKKDPHHPRHSVVRAMIHRGADVAKTEGKSFRFPIGDAPDRDGWVPLIPVPYPAEQEED